MKVYPIIMDPAETMVCIETIKQKCISRGYPHKILDLAGLDIIIQRLYSTNRLHNTTFEDKSVRMKAYMEKR